MSSLFVAQSYRARGFTLVEVMMVLLLISIIMTMAISFGRSMWLENRSTVIINDLIQTLNYARSTAILRNEKIIVCPSSDQKTCDSNDWSRGQVVRNSAGELLRIFSGLSAEERLIWNSSLNKDQAIEWLPSGYTNGQRGSFYCCPGNAQPQNAKKLVVLNTGRLYSAGITGEEYQEFCSDSATKNSPKLKEFI